MDGQAAGTPTLRRLLDGTGVSQSDVARWLDMWDPKLSRILNGREPMPEGFEACFRQAVADITHERHIRAQMMIEEQERQAQAEEVAA